MTTELLNADLDFTRLLTLPHSIYAPSEPEEIRGDDAASTTNADLIEDAADPHRLSRMNLERYASNRSGATLRYWRGEWYAWKRDRYRRIPTDELKAKITASIRREFEELWREEMAHYEEKQKSGQDDDESGPPKVRKVTRNLITDVMNATAGIVIVSSNIEPLTWIGTDGTREQRNYVSMKNGIVDMDAVLADQDDVIIPHTPEWFSTISLPYDFDPEAKCPKWVEFIDKMMDMDPERVKILQEWAGYLLLPDTGEQKFLVNEGDGGNGKSVFCAAISAMLGEDNCSHVPLEEFGDRFSKSTTIGKLVNISADVGEIDRLCEGYLKSFTSGDAMYFDRKGIAPLQCVPTARMMINWNNRPRINDPSSGIWRRMILIPWDVEVTEAEKIKGMDKADWWERSGELPGILNWAIDGLARLRAQRGFTKSSKADESKDDYRQDTNPTRRFLSECLSETKISDRENGLYCEFLYSIYCYWMKRNGHKGIFASNVFGKHIRKVFNKIDRVKDYAKNASDEEKAKAPWFYRGVKFNCEMIFGERLHDGICWKKTSDVSSNF